MPQRWVELYMLPAGLLLLRGNLVFAQPIAHIYMEGGAVIRGTETEKITSPITGKNRCRWMVPGLSIQAKNTSNIKIYGH